MYRWNSYLLPSDWHLRWPINLACSEIADILNEPVKLRCDGETPLDGPGFSTESFELLALLAFDGGSNFKDSLKYGTNYIENLLQHINSNWDWISQFTIRFQLLVFTDESLMKYYSPPRRIMIVLCNFDRQLTYIDRLRETFAILQCNASSWDSLARRVPAWVQNSYSFWNTLCKWV